MTAFRSFATIAAVTVAGFATAAFAEPKPPVPAPAAATAASDTQLYCVIDTVTGSRVAKKVCKTKAQWLDRGVDVTAGR